MSCRCPSGQPPPRRRGRRPLRRRAVRRRRGRRGRRSGASIRSFDLDHFLQGARAAFAMIVEAFAKGDKAALAARCWPTRSSPSSPAPSMRASRRAGRCRPSWWRRAAPIWPTPAMIGGRARVTVRFTSEQINVTRDASRRRRRGRPAADRDRDRPLDLRARHPLARPELAAGRDGCVGLTLGRHAALELGRCSHLARCSSLAAAPRRRSRRPQPALSPDRRQPSTICRAGPRTTRPARSQAFQRTCERWAQAGRRHEPSAAQAASPGRCRLARRPAPRPRGPPARRRRPQLLRDQPCMPFAVTDRGNPDGLFTGYYEPLLRGAGAPDAATAIRSTAARPIWSASISASSTRSSQGRRIAGRVEQGKLVPYADRAAIDGGALAGRDLELLWVDDPVAPLLSRDPGLGPGQAADGSSRPRRLRRPERPSLSRDRQGPDRGRGRSRASRCRCRRSATGSRPIRARRRR